MRLRRQRWSLVSAMARLIVAQQNQLQDAERILTEMRDQADREVSDLHHLILECHRATRDVAVGARLAAMQGADILDDLDALIADLSDSIANMEEHLVPQ